MGSEELDFNILSFEDSLYKVRATRNNLGGNNFTEELMKYYI